ncbi:MAG: hypothetical protein QME92_11935 [Bacillota bacterium]|nr:hypothetical protein [Bacillota bacterium]
MALILLAGFSAIPGTPLEAALVDGASPREMLHYVTLSLLRAIILIALLLRTMDALKMFDVVFALTGGDRPTAPDFFQWASTGPGSARAAWWASPSPWRWCCSW